MRLWLLLALLATVAHADGKQTVIEGRVVGPDGKPIAGATIIYALSFETSGSSFAGEPSAADGSFALALTPSTPLRSIMAFAYLKGYSSSLEATTPPKGTKGYRSPVLKLRPTIDFTIAVTDGENAPVPTATVTIPKDNFSSDVPLLGVAQPVDGGGKLVLKGLNDRDSVDVDVAAPGFLPVHMSLTLGKGSEVIGIVRGGRVKGRLVDHLTGAPVAGCTVTTYAGNTTTDPQGAFELVAPYGYVQLWPNCPAYGIDHDLPRGGLGFTFDAKTTAVQTLKVRHNQRVEVVVLDGRAHPVAGATVTRTLVPKDPTDMRYQWDGPVVEREVTDAAGRAAFTRSSMDEFVLGIDGAKVQRQLHFVDVKGPVTLVQ